MSYFVLSLIYFVKKLLANVYCADLCKYYETQAMGNIEFNRSRGSKVTKIDTQKTLS